MRRLVPLILVISLFSIPVSSQVPSPDIQWTADWEIDQDVAIMDLDSDTYRFELSLEFWINNNRATPIEVDFEVSFEEIEFEVDDPGQVSISGNSNETFDLKITGSGQSQDGMLYNADEFTETVTLQMIEMIGGQAADSSREITQNLEFSQIFDMRVKYEMSGLTSENAEFSIKAGTSKSINVQVFNFGNTDDAITKYSVSSSRCPLLDDSFEPASSLPMPIIPASNVDDGLFFGTLEVKASASHPTKECKLELSVYSEATSYSSYATLTVDVEAVENEVADDTDTNEGSDITETKELESESTSLPAISSILCIFITCICAVIRREN